MFGHAGCREVNKIDTVTVSFSTASLPHDPEPTPLFISSFNLFLELWFLIFTSLLNISAWVSKMHLKLNTCKSNHQSRLPCLPKSFLLWHSPSLKWQHQILGVIMTPFFLSYPSVNLEKALLAPPTKTHPEPSSFLAPPCSRYGVSHPHLSPRLLRQQFSWPFPFLSCCPIVYFTISSWREAF